MMRRVGVMMALALAVACAPDDDREPPEVPAEGDATPRLAATVTGLSGPEAVKYDPAQDAWLISNFGPSADDQRDGNGFVSRVSPDGTVETLRLMEGTPEQPLHMPRGMALAGDTLWVADVDGIHGFHRVTGEALAFVDFRALEPGFLNDIAADPSGTLYVTDTGRGRVYSIDGRAATIAVEDERTGPPNGITWLAEREAFVLVPWGGGQTLRTWSPDGSFGDLVTIPGGNFDGVEVVEGRILVASQSDSTLWSVQNGTAAPVTRLDGTPADIGVDPARGRVAIPYISRDLVEIWEVPGIATGIR